MTVAFLFPGQGAQTVGMGREWCDAHESIRKLFDHAADILGYDLAQVCFEGPAEKLNSTVYSQPALFVCSVAALEVLRDTSPDVVQQCGAAAGLSLGEYTAMVFSGALSFEEGLRVVQRRGEAMQEASDETPSGMVSLLGMEREAVRSLCDEAREEGEILQIANYLCPGNIVVSGHLTACERVSVIAQQKGEAKVVPLAVAGAFHTSLMESAVPKLAEVLQSVAIATPKIPVISNVDAKFHEAPDEIREVLQRQVCWPVLWEDCMRQLIGQGFRTFYEVGPGRVLRGLMKRIDRSVTCQGVDQA